MLRKLRNSVVAMSLFLVSAVVNAQVSGSYPTATVTVGGAETAPGGVWDAGLVTVNFNGFTETVNYGQYSTKASLASGLAALFCRDYLGMGLYAKAGANHNSDPNVITFQLANKTAFGTVDIQAPTSSFTFSTSGFGGASGSTWDQGTATLWFNGTAIATADYGQGSSGASIARDLSVQSNSPLVAVTAEGQNLFLQSKQTGAYSDSYNLTFSTSASFSSPQPSGTLSSSTDASPVPVYSYNAAYDPAGNVFGLADPVMGTWTYGYDNLNRLTSGQASSSGGGPYAGLYTCWSYDNFGNRLSQSVSTTPCGSSPPSTYAAAYSAKNQIASVSAPANVVVSYDDAGSVTNDGFNSYTYDAEGRICAVNGPQGMMGYQYDAEGNRIGKGTISTMSCDITANGYSPITDYVLDQSGGQMTEVAVGGGTQIWAHTNVTANGMLIATYDTTGSGLHFYLNDALGSRRVQTDAAGIPEQTCQNLPFGDQLYCSGSLISPTDHHFTGLEHDTESGLEHTPFRQYASTMGRWMSPDPYNGSIDLGNPQTLNRYNYVLNNPLGFVDPLGLDTNCQFRGSAHTSLAGRGIARDDSGCEGPSCTFDSCVYSNPIGGGTSPCQYQDQFGSCYSQTSGGISGGSGGSVTVSGNAGGTDGFFDLLSYLGVGTSSITGGGGAPSKSVLTCVGQALSGGTGRALALDAIGDAATIALLSNPASATALVVGVAASSLGVLNSFFSDNSSMPSGLLLSSATHTVTTVGTTTTGLEIGGFIRAGTQFSKGLSGLGVAGSVISTGVDLSSAISKFSTCRSVP